MGRKKLETEEDFFNYEPQKSIINILIIAPDFNDIYKTGLEPKELRELIVNDYTIQRTTYDEKRYALLQEFRNFLSIYRCKDVVLDQNTIKPGRYTKKKGRNTSTTIYDLFNKTLRNLIDKDWIKKENGLYAIDEKHKLRYNFARMKQWHKGIIDNSNKDRIFMNPETIFYFMSDVNINHNMFSDLEFYSIDCHTGQIIKELTAINKVFKKVSKRKANQIWKKFIKNFDSPYYLKEFIWINLIGQYFSETLALKNFNPDPDILKIIYAQAKDDVKLFYKDLDLKDNDFKLRNLNNDIIKTYKLFKRGRLMEYFSYEIIENASKQYIEKNYKIILNDYTILSSQAIVTRIINIAKALKQEITNYLMIYENPFFLSDCINIHDTQKNIESLLNWKNINCIKKNLSNNGYISEEKILSQKIDKIKDRYALNIKMEDPISYVLDEYSYQQRKQGIYNLNIPSKKERKKMKNTFFSESTILKKYKNKIKGLGLDYKEIINELDSFSNNFDMPEEKS